MAHQLESVSSGIIMTRRVSEGRLRDDVAGDVSPSLAYASGSDHSEMRNLQIDAS
ncbi:MAG: hypothetical protein ACK57G_03890 [Planctomycetota bacterium]